MRSKYKDHYEQTKNKINVHISCPICRGKCCAPFFPPCHECNHICYNKVNSQIIKLKKLFPNSFEKVVNTECNCEPKDYLDEIYRNKNLDKTQIQILESFFYFYTEVDEIIRKTS